MDFVRPFALMLKKTVANERGRKEKIVSKTIHGTCQCTSSKRHKEAFRNVVHEGEDEMET